ncbi:MAG: chorismate mutase [Patescibacteria group bacterium]|nr:chorismate mutase [Patescibacteria group bacterium]
MPCRGVRGATTADENNPESILEATRQLLALMIHINKIEPEDVASAIFTTTSDLNAEFPALAARQLGWFDVALMCYHELEVPGSLRRCIRILLHWNTNKESREVVHVYIKNAARLRPDRDQLPPVNWLELEGWITEHVDQTKKIASARKAARALEQAARRVVGDDASRV